MPRYFERFSRHLDEFIRESGEFQQAVQNGMSRQAAFDSLKANRDFVDKIKRQRVRLEGGFVAIEPGTGHVLAWVGGTDYSTIQRDNVSQLRRQAGSTFKPFVYALAIDNGYQPWHEFSRFPVSFRDRRGNIWAPNDMSIAPGPEMVSMREALARSLNNVTVRMLPELAGAPDTDQLEDLFPAARQIATMARNMGIKSSMNPVPSIALGTAEVNLLELVNSFTTFANNGVYMDPVTILRIEDREGNILYEAPPQMQQEVMSPITAYTLIDMMRGVISGGDWGHGTGVRLRNMGVRQDVAGKTGTTNNAADNWFVAVYPHVVAGSWVGGEDRRIRFPERSLIGQGARTALPIVGEWSVRVMNDQNGNWSYDAFEQPTGYIAEPPRDQRRQDRQDSERRGRIGW
jgi:penicillin-binding protein 1A